MKFKKSSDVLVFAAGTVKGHSNKWAHPELKKKASKNLYYAKNDEEGFAAQTILKTTQIFCHRFILTNKHSVKILEKY